MQTHVPLPTDSIFCTTCRANVRPDRRGRCPADGVLGIYPEGRPRPEMVTETLVRLQEIARVGQSSGRGVHRVPRNVRQLRAGAH